MDCILNTLNQLDSLGSLLVISHYILVRKGCLYENVRSGQEGHQKWPLEEIIGIDWRILQIVIENTVFVDVLKI